VLVATSPSQWGSTAPMWAWSCTWTCRQAEGYPAGVGPADAMACRPSALVLFDSGRSQPTPGFGASGPRCGQLTDDVQEQGADPAGAWPSAARFRRHWRRWRKGQPARAVTLLLASVSSCPPAVRCDNCNRRQPSPPNWLARVAQVLLCPGSSAAVSDLRLPGRCPGPRPNRRGSLGLLASPRCPGRADQ